MKKIIIVFIVISFGISLQAQDTSTVSLSLRHLNHITKEISNLVPRFKLYKTDNTYNLIKLDTATGALWQVQYEMNNSASAMVIPINDESLLWSSEEIINGRFELYPTNNIYTFILLDTQQGATYQVQWHIQPEKRFRILLR